MNSTSRPAMPARNDIRKHATIEAAFASLNTYSVQHFVFLGDATDARPFWVVDARNAERLAANGYERA